MNPNDAQQALDNIRIREEQALRAGHPPLPWWSLGAKALLVFPLFAGSDIAPAWNAYGFLVLFPIWLAGGYAIDRLVERSAGVKIRPVYRSVGWTLAQVGYAVAFLAVLLGAKWLFEASGAPLPGTLTGLVAAVSVVLLTLLMHHARYRGSLRRDK